MSETTTTIVIMLLIMVIIAAAYLIFPRQTKNLWTRLRRSKMFVVVHLRFENTDFTEDYNVVPEPDYLTIIPRVKKAYNLNPKYAIIKWKKRNHFIVDENNQIPLHFAKDTKNEIVIQATETKTALTNDVMDFMYSKKKDLYMILLICMIGGLVILAIFNVWTITKILPILDSIANSAAAGQIK